MKKLFVLFVALFVSFAFVACTEETTTAAATTTGAETTATTTVTEAANEFPTLSGVQSQVTINVGDTYDPFAGVTANDAEDGDITDSITIDNLACLYLDESNVVGPEAGGATCILVYKAEDSEGAKAQQNSTVTVNVVTDPSLNMIVNGDFTLGTNAWANTDGSLLDLINGGAGTAEVTNEELVVTVTEGSWDGGAFPRVNQEGLTFENGKTYEVSIDAKADTAGIVFKTQVGIFLPASPWFTEYYYSEDGIPEFELTTEYQTFTYKFTVTEPTTEEGTLTLELGANPTGSNYVFYFDNIVIKEATPDPDTSAPVFSGLDDVNVGLSEAFDPLDGVTFYDVDTTLTNEDIVITHDGGATVTEETDGTFTFSQLGDVVFTYVLEDSEGNVATETRTVTVVAMVYDQPYELVGTMTAVADEDSVMISYTNTPAQFWANIALLEIVRFDGTQTSISFEFIGVDTQNYLFKVEFADGTAPIEHPVTADGTLQTVTIDLSALTEAQRDTLSLFAFFSTTEGASGTADIMNVTYDQKDYTEAWTGYGMTTEADYEKEVVFYDVIGDPWWNVNAQLPVTGFDGTQTSITFTFLGVEDQTYMIKVENSTMNIETPFVGTGAMQDVVVDLSGWSEAERTDMSLFVLFVNQVGAPAGEITVYGWDYTPANVATWNVYGSWAITADEDSELITYPESAAGQDWGSNAQLPITFDGTKTSIDLTVIGTAGHTYLLKIEMTGGHSAEVQFTATGASQVVTLDLSHFSETERGQLNLLVLFAMQPAEAGTLDIFGWDYTPATS